MWKRLQIKIPIRRNIWGPYTDHTQQKLILLLAQGETPMSPILCGYEYWVSFWLVGLGSISHISSVPAVVIPLRGNHFSCHRGRAAPDTLNDLSPWRNHQSGAFPAVRSEGLFGERAYARKALFGKRAYARKAFFGKRAHARTVKARSQDALFKYIEG